MHHSPHRASSALRAARPGATGRTLLARTSAGAAAAALTALALPFAAQADEPDPLASVEAESHQLEASVAEAFDDVVAFYEESTATSADFSAQLSTDAPDVLSRLVENMPQSDPPTEDPTPPPGAAIEPCNIQNKSGGAGTTDTWHQLGARGPTSFTLYFDTRNIPDEIWVFYEGHEIYYSGVVGNKNNPPDGVGSDTVSVPAGAADEIMVRVTGPAETKWDYTVHCA